MSLHPDFFIDPVIRTRPQKVMLVENGSSFTDVARMTIKEYSKCEDWDEPFYVCDLGIILSQYKRWMRELPNVQPFYAVKSNPLTPMINTLAALGAGFDCASKNEVNHVLSCGVSPDRIVFANTYKMTSHICVARTRDVKMMTLDSEEELLKISRHFPNARLLLRLHMDDTPGTTSKFAGKFGANFEQCKILIKKAKQLGVDLVGVCYHVGCGNRDVDSFRKANSRARQIFDFAKTCGFDFNILDIGGGFPGTADDNETISFEMITEAIRESLDEHFPPSSGVKLIAEPGRFFPGQAFNLVTSVHGKRKIKGGMSYVVSDGLYNSFSNVLIEGMTAHPKSFSNAKDDRETITTTIFGPSCDGIDVITRSAELAEMNIGEWIIWKDMGCYTAMMTVGFNGFQTCKAKYFCGKDAWAELKKLCELPDLLPGVYNYNFEIPQIPR